MIEQEEETYKEDDGQEDDFLLNANTAFTDDENVDVDIEIFTDDEVIQSPGEETEEAPGEETEEAESDDEQGMAVGYRKSGGRLVGKHSLKRDSIFNGKEVKNNTDEEYWFDDNSKSFNLDPTSSLVEEVSDQEEADRIRLLKEYVYNNLANKVVDMSAPRRKPSKVDFNNNFVELKNAVPMGLFSDAELFVELSSYFSDNLYSMFKLLDKEHSEKIIVGLMDKYNLSMLDSLDFQ